MYGFLRLKFDPPFLSRSKKYINSLRLLPEFLVFGFSYFSFVSQVELKLLSYGVDIEDIFREYELISVDWSVQPSLNKAVHLFYSYYYFTKQIEGFSLGGLKTVQKNGESSQATRGFWKQKHKMSRKLKNRGAWCYQRTAKTCTWPFGLVRNTLIWRRVVWHNTSCLT